MHVLAAGARKAIFMPIVKHGLKTEKLTGCTALASSIVRKGCIVKAWH